MYIVKTTIKKNYNKVVKMVLTKTQLDLCGHNRKNPTAEKALHQLLLKWVC